MTSDKIKRTDVPCVNFRTKNDSAAGNWARVFRVTGGNTNHYTTADLVREERQVLNVSRPYSYQYSLLKKPIKSDAATLLTIGIIARLNICQYCLNPSTCISASTVLAYVECIDLARIWTAIAGFRVQSADRYTTRSVSRSLNEHAPLKQ